MKKILLATTVLAAAGFTSAASAAEWETGVSGYYFLGLGVTDGAGQNGVGVLRDGEFHINGRLTADNGLVFRARVEVESFTSSDQIDENWGSVGGSFGTLTIGSNDTVGYENSVGVIYAPGARIGYADSFALTTDAGVGGSATPGVGVDGLGIHYNSPDFMGFQVHGTYIPSLSSDGGAVNNDTNNPVFDGGDELWNIAASYNGDFGDFGFGVSTSYTDIEGVAGEQINGALKVSFSGFTVAGFYEDDFAGDEFGVGAQYATGPWTVAGGYTNSDAGATDHVAAGWVTYAAAPGVLFTVGVEYANVDGDGQSGDFGGLGFMTLRF